MRKFLVSAALIASTVGVAAPAAAQWAPPPPQGYAYGYQGNYGQTRRLEARIQRLRQEIRRLDRRDILSNREARRLDNEARELQFRVQRMSYNGLSRREAYEVERRIERLEQRIRYAAGDGGRRYGRGLNPFAGQPGVYQQGYGQRGYGDRDDDDDDHRYEGRRHDRDDD